MTWIEVVDSAIKIGLGALIGGLFSYLNSKAERTYGARKEYNSFRRELLRQASLDCTLLHRGLFGENKDLYKSAGELRRQLFAIESNLILTGEASVIEAFEKYSTIAHTLRKTLDWDSTIDKKLKEEKSLEQIKDELMESSGLNLGDIAMELTAHKKQLDIAFANALKDIFKY